MQAGSVVSGQGGSIESHNMAMANALLQLKNDNGANAFHPSLQCGW
jgi:hypothetical protein